MFPIFMQYVDSDEKTELQKCQSDYEENLTISFPAGIPVKESKTIKDIQIQTNRIIVLGTVGIKNLVMK